MTTVRGLLFLIAAGVIGHLMAYGYELWRSRGVRPVTGAPDRSLRQRIDEVFVEPDAPNGEWSSKRVALMLTLFNFNVLALLDREFRDPGAYVTVLGILIAVTWGANVLKLDLTAVLGKAAETIGRRWRGTREEEPPPPESAPAASPPPDVDRSGIEQEP